MGLEAFKSKNTNSRRFGLARGIGCINIVPMAFQRPLLKPVHRLNLRVLSIIISHLICTGPIANAQPLPSHENWGDQKVRVNAVCAAFSMLPNDRQNISVKWNGPCEDGLAHGDGVQTISLKSVALSVSQITYIHGRATKHRERYVFELGSLFLKNGNETTSGTRVFGSNLPSWATELTTAESVWSEWRQQDIERRQAEVSAVYGNQPEIDDEWEEEGADEKNPENSEELPQNHRIF